MSLQVRFLCSLKTFKTNSIETLLLFSSIIANTALCVKHLQFSKVFWDYSAADNNVSEESPSSAELPSSSTNVERMSSLNSERTKATHFLSPSSKYRPQGKQQACETFEQLKFFVRHF